MWFNDPNYLLGGFYWPILDILVWGFLGTWIQSAQATQLQNYELAALLGILLWQVVGRGCNIMVIAFAEELWANNVVNLFSLPLSIIEWMCGVMLFTIMMIGLTATFSALFIFFLYNVSLWQLITTFLLFFPSLFITSIWLGFTALQIIVFLGKRGAEFAFVFGWMLLPFSGAYYPIDVLPRWGQAFSSLLPMSYLFTGMREYVMKNQDPMPYILKGTVMAIFYAIAALILFAYCFHRTKRRGLARLAE